MENRDITNYVDNRKWKKTKQNKKNEKKKKVMYMMIVNRQVTHPVDNQTATSYSNWPV